MGLVRKILSSITIKMLPSEVKELSFKIASLKEIDYDSENQRLQLVIRLLISGEDHRFRFHPGFDIIAIFRAFKQKIIHNQREGASTIDQQLVRVLTGDYRKCLRRKIKEILLATTLTRFIDRRNIPVLYLHIAYFGNGLAGIKELFLKKHITSSIINLKNAAEIVARIKYPEPANLSLLNIRKINIRKLHLIKLYRKHAISKMYFYKLDK